MYSKFLLIGSIVLFVGCSSRQYYTPQKIASSVSPLNSEEVAYFNRAGATLDNGQVLVRRGALKLILKKGYKFINGSSNGIIISNKDGKCTVLRNGKTQAIELPKEVVAGSIFGDKLVYVLRDNNYGIYDLSKNSIVFNDNSQRALNVDIRIENPIKVENLVVIPLLNGKIVILDLASHKVIKDILVSDNDILNNIILLKQVDNTLIAVTPHKIIAISKNGRREFAKEISEVIIDNDGSIFVFAKDGKIFRLDKNLTVQDEKKFRFAHFSVATVYKDRVYALDKQGYLIVSNKNFTKYKVYEVPEVDGFSFVSGKYIYYDGNKIDLDSLTYE